MNNTNHTEPLPMPGTSTPDPEQADASVTVTARMIDITPHYPNLYQQFMREFEADITRAINHSRRTGNPDDLKFLRVAMNSLNIALLSARHMDPIEGMRDFCARFDAQAARLTAAHENLETARDEANGD